MADWPTVKVEIAWPRRARRHGAYGVPKGWRDVTRHIERVSCLLTVDNDMEAMAEAYNRWYAKANPLPLFADGQAYRRRCLARRRRR